MVNSKIQAAEENLIHVYNRFPIALDHGEGMYLYDTEGKEYLDFAAGFAVSGLGYDNKELNQALKDQIDKLYIKSLFPRELWRGSKRIKPHFRNGQSFLYKQWRRGK